MFTLKNFLILIGKNALISLIVVLITIFTIIFISKKIEILSNKIALNNKIEYEYTNRNELEKTLKNEILIVSGNDTKIESAFPPSNNILDFVNAIDSLANNNNISQTYHFETPILLQSINSFNLETISYTNNFSTNMSVFINYLKEFEKLPYFTKIDGFNISSQDKMGWVGISNISLRGTLYTKKI